MINRKALFVGAFLAAAGTVMLVGQGSDAAQETITQALALWPLAVIAIGVGLLLRYTRLSLAGALVAAIVPGLLFGGVVVAAPDVDMASICDEAERAVAVDRGGTFAGPAIVELHLACGELDLTTIPGTGWTVRTLDIAGHPVSVVESPGRLAVASSDGHGGWGFGRDGDRWTVGLPTGVPVDLEASIAAGRGRFDLAGARLGVLALQVSAGDARVDLTAATIESLAVDVSAGATTVLLPAGSDVSGVLTASAGAIEICAPAGLGVRVQGVASLGSTTFNGLVRVGDAWETPGYSSSTYQADLSVSASAGSVTINPEGGCK